MITSVRRRRDFERLAASTLRARSATIRVVYCSREPDDPAVAVAFAVGRRVGSAVARNRIRRRLRAALRELEATMPEGLYLIKCDIGTSDLTYEELRTHLREGVRRASTR
ncbi:MAG: ribonuclease P protein component [Acidimicrobiales bacterium]